MQLNDHHTGRSFAVMHDDLSRGSVPVKQAHIDYIIALIVRNATGHNIRRLRCASL